MRETTSRRVIDLDAWRCGRAQTKAVVQSAESVVVKARRGNLHVSIDEDGGIDYGMGDIALADAPAVMMACMILCMRLVTQIDEQGIR